MACKIFINYRRDDSKAEAARLRDRLAQTFGAVNVFMDVDNLLAGERFDLQLQAALGKADIFLAVIGPRWIELLRARAAKGERDYVRDEIAVALVKGLTVIPVSIDRTPLPRPESLPADIRNLVLHQKHDVIHESFGRDVSALIEAIKAGRRASRKKTRALPWKSVAIGAAAMAALAGIYIFTRAPELPLPDVSHHLARANAPLSAIEVAALKPKDSFKECENCPEMVVIPAGSFVMGSFKDEPERDSSEGPTRWVPVRKSFAVGKFAATFSEWDACVADGGCGGYSPSDKNWGRGDRPVINVSWDDAKAYVKWLSQKTGKAYRLLSEAEREYVTRADNATPFWWGFRMWGDPYAISTEWANYDGDYTYPRTSWRWWRKGENRNRTVSVKSFSPNPWGLYQVHGNVWEWVEDCWNDDYKDYDDKPRDGSPWITGDCTRHVLRGGSWFTFPRYLRSAARIGPYAVIRHDDNGFRVARSLTP
jgi:formylglycine-generating enzyme required for sulfatase activity